MKGQLLAHTSLFAVSVGFIFGTCTVQAQDRHVIVANRYGEPMEHLYASPIRNRSVLTGGDRLGNGVLASDQQITLDMPNGSGDCRYDFLAVYADGTWIFQADVNICVVPEVNF